MQSIDKQPDYWQTRINASGLDCPDISGTFADSNELFLFDDIRGKVSFDLGGEPNYYPWQWHRCADCAVAIEWRGAGFIELFVSLLSPSAGQVDKLTSLMRTSRVSGLTCATTAIVSWVARAQESSR